MIQQIIEKLGSQFGLVKKELVQKNWAQIWQAAREYNLLQLGTKVTAPYAQHLDVYKSIKAISDNVGQADFDFYKGDTQVKNPDLSALFNSPNPLMSRSQLWEATAMYMSLRGNCFWYMTDSVGKIAGTGRTLPAEIWIYNPDYFKPYRDINGNLLYWTYRNAEIIDPANLIHFKYFNPYDPILGLAPYEPIHKTVDLDYQSLIYNSKFFENGATPGYVLSTDGTLSDDQFKRLKTQWEAEHKGVNQAHRMALLEGGLKPVSVGESHREMEFTAQRQLNREDIMGIWRVPKSMFGITDGLNFATFQGQKKMFWTDTIVPLLNYVEEELNAHFFPRFAPGLTGKFEFGNVLALQDSIDDKLARAQKFFSMGVPFNTIDKELALGVGEIPGGDVGYLPFNLQPIGVDKPEADPVSLPLPAPAPEPIPKPAPKSKKALDRAEVSKRFVMVQDKIEKKFEAVIKDYFYRQRAQVLEAVGAKGFKIASHIQINWIAQNDDLVKTTSPLINESVNSGATFAESLLGAGSIDFNLLDPTISSIAQDRFSKVTDINTTVKDQLQGQLDEALQGGDTTAQIADRVRSVYNMAGNRAKVIARTEVTGAMNSGTFAAFKQAGIQKKQWTSSHDDLVRETHQEVDGETVGIDQIFSNGVDFPGGNGAPEEVINCRCSLTPVFD